MNFKNIPRVLIIDDQKSNRLMLKLTLKNAGKYSFLEADNGEDGINIAIAKLPHIILIDAMMPKMNGFEAIKILRNNTLTQNIPIVMISALDDTDQNVQALMSGVSDFISKPFKKTELITRVNSLLHLYMMYIQNKKKLKNINKKLEKKVNENVKIKLEDIKMATLGKIATSITHELNTPITYMKSNIEMMEHDLKALEGNDTIKKYLLETHSILNNGLKRLQNIINNTKEISKKGKSEFNNENLYSSIIFSSRIIFNRSKHLMPIYINNTLFDLDLNKDYEIYESSLIKEKIEQVWIIIMNNACDEFEKSIKEYDQRKMIIDIVKKKDKIKVFFKDNASDGIPNEILSNIFDPFVSTKIDKGMGVGLNIAKEIIEEHYGTIKAYNENSLAVFEVEI